MEKIKFTTRVDGEALAAAKTYAARHGTSVSRLVDEFFKSLKLKSRKETATPVLDELAGSLSQEATTERYVDYLEEKYLNDGPRA